MTYLLSAFTILISISSLAAPVTYKTTYDAGFTHLSSEPAPISYEAELRKRVESTFNRLANVTINQIGMLRVYDNPSIRLESSISAYAKFEILFHDEPEVFVPRAVYAALNGPYLVDNHLKDIIHQYEELAFPRLIQSLRSSLPKHQARELLRDFQIHKSQILAGFSKAFGQKISNYAESLAYLTAIGNFLADGVQATPETDAVTRRALDIPWLGIRAVRLMRYYTQDTSDLADEMLSAVNAFRTFYLRTSYITDEMREYILGIQPSELALLNIKNDLKEVTLPDVRELYLDFIERFAHED